MRFLRPVLLALTLAGVALAITLVISTGITSAHTGADGGSHHDVSAIQAEGPQCDADGRCSHGPDPAPPGVDPATVDLPEDFTESAFAVCDGNGSSGKRVQVLYVRASDRPDQFALYENSFRGWAAEGDHIYQESARVTGGVRYLRFVHDSNCRIDVINVTVSPSGDADFWALTGELKAQGFNNPNRKYLVFLDSNHPDFCGQADVFADDSPGSDNLNNTRTGFAVIYNGCWSSQVTIAHELGHNLGAVQRTSPNASRWDHCIDEWDVMCYDDGSGAGYELEYPCEDQSYNELLDCNNDDYFHTNPPSGNWLRTHWNIADSGWLGAKDARIELSLETGYYNTVVSAQLTKFTPGQVVTLRWPDMSVLGTVTADSQGRGSASFRIPLSPYGSYTVLAKDASGMSATDLIDVRPRMTLSETSGYPGAPFRVTLYGYEPDDVVEIRWSRFGGGYDVIASIPIADNGRGTQIVQVPYSVEVGSHTIRGAVPNEIQWSSGSFTLLQTPWTVTLDKSSSKYNGVVNATLAGFAPNSPVTLRWADGSTLISGTTNGSGGGVLSFTTPLAPLGDYPIVAADGADHEGVAMLRVIPRAKMSEISAYPGAVVRVYYYGFAPGDVVETRFYLDDGVTWTVLNTLTIAENGRGSSLVTLPITAGAGNHTVRGSVIGASRSTSTSIRVLDPPWSVALDKDKSKYNGTVTASVAGFDAGEPITLRWADGTVLDTGFANGSGSVVLDFRTPLSPLGDYYVYAEGSTGKVAVTTLRVIPRILLNEDEGEAGDRIRVYFYGFAPGNEVEVRFSTGASTYEVLGIVTIAENGRGTQLVYIPEDASPGEHTVTGKVIGISRSATTTFEVTNPGGADDPTSTPSPSQTPTGTPEPTVTTEPTPDLTGTPEPETDPTETPEPPVTEEPPTETPTPDPTETPEPETETPTPTETPVPEATMPEDQG